jgi:hypothetical protein
MTTGFAGDGVVHQFFGGAYWAKERCINAGLKSHQKVTTKSPNFEIR